MAGMCSSTPSVCRKVAISAINRIFCRFGMPLTIHTDQGSIFVGNVLNQFMNYLKFEKHASACAFPGCTPSVSASTPWWSTDFSGGSSNPARSPNPWAVDSTVTQSRPGGPMFPEPDEPLYNYCPIMSDCNNSSRLVRHATVQHLPWFANPSTVCWLCGTQCVMGTK